MTDIHHLAQQLSQKLTPILKYQFKNIHLLRAALTHRSKTNENFAFSHNERMEYLGDAVVELVISHLLYRNFQDASEGELSRLRSTIVNTTSLAHKARSLDLGKFLQVGQGEEQSLGRNKDSLLADAFEAIIAGIYLDGGFTPAFEFVERLFAQDIPYLQKIAREPKTDLQELCQKQFRSLPHYRVIEETGPEHQRTYGAEVIIQDKVFGKGYGKSKKLAEQAAAQAALTILQTKYSPS